jgi:hypothetical protein
VVRGSIGDIATDEHVELRPVVAVEAVVTIEAEEAVD